MPRAPPRFQNGAAQVQRRARPIIEFPTPVRPKNRTQRENQSGEIESGNRRFAQSGRNCPAITAMARNFVSAMSVASIPARRPSAILARLRHFLNGLQDDRRVGVMQKPNDAAADQNREDNSASSNRPNAARAKAANPPNVNGCHAARDGVAPSAASLMAPSSARLRAAAPAAPA